MIARDVQSSREDGDPIEVYLDELLASLRGTARDVRRSLAECEAHLRESVERRIEAGSSPQEAAAQALEAFGSVPDVATRFNRAHRPAAMRALAPSLMFQAWRMTAVGLIAIGVSGVIAWLTALVAGTSAVFADAPGTHYGTGACAHYLAVQPTAKTCAAAALLETRDDALSQRWAAGLLGVVLLAAAFWWQRRRAAGPQPMDLRIPAALISLTAFGIAGIGLTGYGIDRAVINTGSGQWISAGSVALAVAVGYLLVLRRQITALPGSG
jgi:hypothetical protein